MSYGVCGAMYDADWSGKFPVACGCFTPESVPMPEMPKRQFSVEMKCATPVLNSQAALEQFAKDNPTKYQEDICRSYRTALFNDVANGLFPNKLTEQENRLKTELQRRMGLYIGSYADFGPGPSFYQCVGAIGFLGKVKLCPDVIPKQVRKNLASSQGWPEESHVDLLARCKQRAINLIRSTLAGVPEEDWNKPGTPWVNFENAHFSTSPDWFSDTTGSDRAYEFLSLDATANDLKNLLSPNCRSARPATNGDTSLRQQQDEFNAKINERTNKAREDLQKAVAQAAERWKQAQQQSSSGSNTQVNTDPASVNVMLRIPCDTKCDLERNQ
jgi:hypothetical protein